MDAFVREFMRFEFTLQLLLVFALMLFPSRRRRFFVLRLILCLIPVGVASYFLIPVGFVTANVRFIVIFLLCVAAAFICFFIDFKNALLCGLGAYAIQHACYCISEVFRLAVSASMESFLWEWVVTRLLFLLSLAAMYFFFIRKFHEKGDFMIKNRPLLLLVVVIVAATIVISNVEGYLDYTVNMPFDGVKIVFCVYRFLCCCLALAIQSGLFERNRLEQENKVLERLRETERRRYETVKDNIDLVNIKYHDLKHMLPLLEEMGGQVSRQGKISARGQVEHFRAGYLCKDGQRGARRRHYG